MAVGVEGRERQAVAVDRLRALEPFGTLGPGQRADRALEVEAPGELCRLAGLGPEAGAPEQASRLALAELPAIDRYIRHWAYLSASGGGTLRHLGRMAELRRRLPAQQASSTAVFAFFTFFFAAVSFFADASLRLSFFSFAFALSSLARAASQALVSGGGG